MLDILAREFLRCHEIAEWAGAPYLPKYEEYWRQKLGAQVSRRNAPTPPTQGESKGKDFVHRNQDHSKVRPKVPPVRNSPKQAPPVQGLRECYFCGRNNHSPDICRLKDHEHSNRDPLKRWRDTPPADLYKTANGPAMVLPYPPKRDAEKGNFLFSLLNSTPLCKTNAVIVYHNNRLSAEALIDSGANSSDYVSTRVARWINEQGLPTETANQSSVQGAWTNSFCRVVGTLPLLNVTLINDFSNEISLLLSNIKIIEGNFDIILGLPTIRKYDLTVNFRSLFGNNSKPAVPQKNQIEDHQAAFAAQAG